MKLLESYFYGTDDECVVGTYHMYVKNTNVVVFCVHFFIAIFHNNLQILYKLILKHHRMGL